MDLNELPTLCIPCDNLKHLKELVDALYDKGILTDENIRFLYCPPDILHILNISDFFEPVEIGGIKAVKGQTEKNTDELL